MTMKKADYEKEQRTVLMQKWSDYIDELKRNYIKSSIIKTV